MFLLTLFVDGQDSSPVQLRYKTRESAMVGEAKISENIGKAACYVEDDYGQAVFVMSRHIRAIVMQDVAKTFEGVIDFQKLQAAAQARASAGGPSLVVPGQAGLQFHQ